VIDLHTHILPGIDDGAQTLEDALDMARAFVADGVTTIAATPHVRDDYPTSADTMRLAVDALRKALGEEGIPLTLLPGAEIAVDRIERLDAGELSRLTLAGSGRYVLVETPYYGWPVEVAEQLLRLRMAGFIPVLAHPERNPEVQRTPSLLAPLVQGGTLVQVTAASLDGRLGARSRETAFHLAAIGSAHLVASDAHTPDIRAAGMRSAAEAIADEALAKWLTEEVPRALVEGRDVPSRPGSN
jgi:protein-tyrosine phosphatase